MKRPILFRTLRGRLIFVAALATVPAFLFVIYVAGKERSAALERAEMDARYVANLASREHALQVAGAARLLERLAIEAQAAGDISIVERVLPIILSGFPQIANLGVLSDSGSVVTSVVPPQLPIEMKDDAAFRAALASDSVAIGAYQVGPIVGRPVLIIARAVRDVKGRAHHVLFAALELAWLDELARQANLPLEHALLIVDQNGTVLARSSSSAARAGGAPLEAIAFRRLLARSRGMTPLKGSDGVTRLAVATNLEGTRDLWIVVGLPEASVYAIANRVFYRDVAVLALLSLLAVLSSVFATDVSILRDLRLLADATRRFGEGNLSARAPLPRPRGEIRDLALAFNSMADALALEHRAALKRRDELRALTHRLHHVREEEAARIAQELHDVLGQELSVLKLELERVRRKLDSEDTVRAREAGALVDEISQRVDAAVQSVRRISSELRPGVLDRLGLVAGLEWLLREFERRTDIRATLITSGVPEPAHSDVSTTLFRITQEALTNIARHSRASEVRAELDEGEGDLVLTIRDNGRGFELRVVEQVPSLGLLGMRERAERLGGSVTIESRPGAGTLLTVSIPKRVHGEETACT